MANHINCPRSFSSQVKDNQSSGNGQLPALFCGDNLPGNTVIGAQTFFLFPKHPYSILVESDGQDEDAFQTKPVLDFLRRQGWQITLISKSKAGALMRLPQAYDNFNPDNDWRMIMINVKLLPDMTGQEEAKFHQILSVSGELSVSIRDSQGFVDWYYQTLVLATL